MAANATQRPNLLLRRARLERDWTLKEVGGKIGVDAKAVGRWERGEVFPGAYYRRKLCKIFDMSSEELGLIKDAPTENIQPTSTPSAAESTATKVVQESATSAAFETPLPTAIISVAPELPIWNVPYRRNPFFTGREAIFERLDKNFSRDTAAVSTYPQALSGLGGIGKTQTAVEYAYRHYHDYQAIFWIRADSREVLITDYIAVAELLHLPEKNEQKQSLIIEAVKRWLTKHARWLLILDNVDDLEMVSDFMPLLSSGHTLLTCRAQVTGTIAQRIELEKMTPEEGAHFLLRRAKLIEPNAPLDDSSYTDWARAKTITGIMDGLPLALDQAGAYIEETARSLSEYLELYQRQHTNFLQQRGIAVLDHPEPVATTWSLSFEKVSQANPAAADLLRLCAFLHPDAIPEEVVTEGASELGPTLQPVAADALGLASAIQELRKFSLVRRDLQNQMLNIHRLVQAVLKDEMDEVAQRQWAERAVRAVSQAFPDVEFVTWQRCERCLAQAQVCSALIKQWDMTFPEASRLLYRAGWYLHSREQYAQVEPLLNQALEMRERTMGPKHPDVAEILSDLASSYEYQGKHAQAEPLLQRALSIWQESFAPEHPDVAGGLNDLAGFYSEQGKYFHAEQLYLQALALREKLLEPTDPNIAQTVNNLATTYHQQGKYTQAEPLYQRALGIWEQALGSKHPEVGTCLNNLGWLYVNWGKYAQAEQILARALSIREETLGPKNSLFASSLNNLAQAYFAQGKYALAESLQERSLAIKEQALGPKHHYVANSINSLAEIYRAQRKYVLAEQFHRRALAMREEAFGVEHPDVAQSLNNLGRLYADQGRYAQAEPLLRQALLIREKNLSSDHPHLAITLNNLAYLHAQQGNFAEAEALYQRALTISEKSLGTEHPEVARALNGLAEMYRSLGEYARAEPLYQRTLSIWRQTLGADHPDVVMVIQNYTDVLRKMDPS